MKVNFNVRKFISPSSIAELSKPTFHIQEIHPSVNELHRMHSCDAECSGSSSDGSSTGDDGGSSGDGGGSSGDGGSGSGSNFQNI